MVESKLLQKLKQEQHAFAVAALLAPSSKDEFEYGYRCGHVAGIERAISVLTMLLDEERKGDIEL